ncbi:MAG: hypothetical protein AAB667_00160 [Patescibacteria group bacterium]
MRTLNNNRKLILTAILLAVLFIGLGLPSQARAEDEQVGVIQRKMAGSMYAVLVITNRGIAALVNILQATLYFKVDAEFPVVKDMWKIVRDFANMLFIVVLIAVAMGTVFNVKSFGFGDLDLGGSFLVQFLIAALLINFSLTIGGLIINGTQVINDTFLASIGNFQDRLGSVLNPKVLIGLPADASEGDASDQFSLNPLQSDLTQNMVVQLFFTLILAIMLLFSLVVPVIFTLARIPMLMLLLVFAPGAWLLGILPSTKEYSSGWWKQFWGWNLFLPFYLLVLYFGLYFLSYQKTILESIDRTGGAGITGFSNITLSTIFFYFVAAMVLTMGTAAAAKASFLGGTSAGRVAGWARGKVGGWWFGGRFAAGAGAGAIAGSIQGARAGAEKGTVSAITGALGGVFTGGKRGLFSSKEVTEAIKKRGVEYAGELKKEGLPGRLGVLYGGTRKGERFGAEVAAVLGDKGAVAARLKTDVGDFKKEYDEANYTPEQLREVISDRRESPQHQLAAYEVLKSKKVLTAPEISNAYNLYKNYSLRNATSFALDIEYDKMSRGERKELYDGIPNPDIRRKLSKVMAQEGEFDSVSALSDAAKLFEPESAKIEFLKSAAKKKLIEAFRVGDNLKLLKGKDGITKLSFTEALKDEVGRRKGDDKLDLISKDLEYTATGDSRPLPTNPRELAQEQVSRQKKEEDYQELKRLIVDELSGKGPVRNNILRNQKLTKTQAEIIERLVPSRQSAQQTNTPTSNNPQP